MLVNISYSAEHRLNVPVATAALSDTDNFATKLFLVSSHPVCHAINPQDGCYCTEAFTMLGKSSFR